MLGVLEVLGYCPGVVLVVGRWVVQGKRCGCMVMAMVIISSSSIRDIIRGIRRMWDRGGRRIRESRWNEGEETWSGGENKRLGNDVTCSFQLAR